MSYQAVVRDADGELISEQTIGMEIRILQGSPDGNAVYSETLTPQTNAHGLVSIEIGNETDLASIDWASGPYYLETRTDPSGGTNYTISGTNQLLSVPYAFYAGRAEKSSITGEETAFEGWDKDGSDDFTGDFSELTNLPANLDLDATDDFSGSFNDLTNVPPDLDLDATDDFSGSYNELTNLPETWDSTYASLKGTPDLSVYATRDMADQTITNLGEPVNSKDAATKGYVESMAAGGWSLSGNAGTNPSSHFLGTTDEQPLSFRVNNLEKMRLEANGSLGFPGSDHNLFLGSGTGANDDGTNNKNVFVGDSTGYNNTTGDDNTGVGYRSLYHNTSGYYNTAVGNHSLSSNITGDYNTVVGAAAMIRNQIGNSNTATGYRALHGNTTGSGNTAIGNMTLSYNTDANFNTAIGYYALHASNGYENTAVGNYAMFYNTIGNRNTALGKYALRSNKTGYYNTAVGFSSGPEVDDLINTTALGYNAEPTADHMVVIGNTVVTQIGGAVGWSNLSDGRFKTGVQENVPGLDLILQLRPVTFHWDLQALDSFKGKNNEDYKEIPGYKKAREEKGKKVYTGFIAQEVEKAAKNCNYDFSAILRPQNEQSTYNLNYAEFVVPLVQAIQEQQKLIEKQQQQIETLRKKVELLK
jgi:hypothetical protein